MATRIAIAKPRIGATDTRRVRPEPKQVDRLYQTPDHEVWARTVKRRAGYRCQAPSCTNAAPAHRMYADHIVEIRDGGKALDLANGQCLCASHHTLKTTQHRAARAARPAN